jgi:predicted component of type VI protein secretion system
MNDHVPSDMIPLHDDMVISFVNYELRVSLLQKTKDELVTQQAEMEEFFANKPASSVPVAQNADAGEEPPKQDAAYTAEVNANAEPEAQAPATSGEEKSAEDGAVAGEEKPAADGNEQPRESTE